MARFKRNSEALFGCGWTLITLGVAGVLIHFFCPQIYVALSMIRDTGNYLIDYVVVYGALFSVILIGGLMTFLSFWVKKKENPGQPVPLYLKEWNEMTSEEKRKFLKYTLSFLILEIFIIALFLFFKITS